MQKFYSQYKQKVWLENRSKQIDAAKAAGKPAPPLTERTYRPTYKTRFITKSQLRHLHDEYLMHAVDGGIVGFLGYIVLIFGTATIAAMRIEWSLQKSAKIEIWALSLNMSILAVFNVAFENDIIAVTFILMMIASRIMGKSYPLFRKSRSRDYSI